MQIHSQRPLQTEEKVSRQSGRCISVNNQRYTLDMVRIDNKIREVVNQIKQEEAKIANLANKIEDAAPQKFL